MARSKYEYNKQSLRYEKIQVPISKRLWQVFSFICGALILAIGIIFVFDSPEEIQLKKELDVMEDQYAILADRMQNMNAVLGGLKERDNKIYSVIFERKPVEQDAFKIRKSRFELYDKLNFYKKGKVVEDITKSLDEIENKLLYQSESYDEIADLIINKKNMLASIPSIQPVSNKDLKRLASGFGRRIDPVYKVPKMHYGLDFSAPSGTPIYATGNGKVERRHYSKGGYGYQIIINHGYGYRTRYAHMSKFNVQYGQRVKRGDVIGFVGNTGKSVGPHLHYEVMYNNRKVDPAYYFFTDLTEEQYEQMLIIASAGGQSLD